MTFKLNPFQQEVFSAIHAFNRNISFEYVEWLKEKQASTPILVKAPEQAIEAVVGAIPEPQTVPQNFFSSKVKIRKMRNGRNIAKEGETDFLLVNISEAPLARQIDEVTLSYSSVAGGWATAIVTRANGKQIVAPYPTVPQFLQRANLRAKRKHGLAQSQPLNFSNAVY